jgi:hypothetical protein
MLSKSFTKIPGALTIVLLVGSLIGCTSQSPTPEAATATAVKCQPSQIQTTETGFSEIQADMNSDGEVWALLFFGAAHANQEAKIVWRITGDETPVAIEARHEDGSVISPIWGPEYHDSSNWERPGDEWGTGFNFPKAGCWTLTVTRGATSGDIRLEVVSP